MMKRILENRLCIGACAIDPRSTVLVRPELDLRETMFRRRGTMSRVELLYP